MNGDYVRFALHSLKSRRLRSWLTMLGIFIGIAAVISLIGLGEGLRTAVISQFGFLGSDVLSVQATGLALAGPPGQAVGNALTTDLTDKIKKVGGVEAALNRHIESGTMEFSEKQAIGMAGSVPEGDGRKVFEEMLNLKTEKGRLLRDGENRKVVLGNDFQKEDIFGRGIAVGDRVLLNDVTFEVVGILEKKGSFIFDSIVMMNEEAMLELFGDEGTVDVIAVKVKDVNEIGNVKQDIEELLRKERDVDEGEEDFIVESPQAILDSLDSTLFAVQLFVTIIALISLLVGGIGITNTMYTAVLERTKEIGIMKSIGATNGTIFALFFFESGFLGAVGGAIGIALGLIGAYGMAFMGRVILGTELIQADVSVALVLGALAFSFIVGTASGLLPALQASRLQPVDALRQK
ncbi:ABC transporter permease [Candidatus Woesearchaeota archaeon]|nr:ABC transporter permease [Candidatus Woesearchaeota archaeon]